MVFKSEFQQLLEQDEGRDILAELDLADAEPLHNAKVTQVEVPEVVAARQSLNLTQESFAELLGISVRTLQEWEQKRRNPSKSAAVLLKVAIRHPEVVKEVTHSFA
ncbi:helix-turn-helix domain-containing protein [Acinetobacter radioresistens]|uniref:helix-turn-helix domain-containing protein n=1 Tax=Acinetobacter radioresistens TaxID=40216 RepID=UPI00200587CA|nr:helix-turn-helix domain-containing protein [Acinetobacter radioresistens]MCK4090640.1 helix-turn-helix domain-containing protein [Acinetobacter radioresistens]MCK4108936.1 helix-turn-helix domain-containing protein [Acinetobacter radioresistens]